MSRPASADGKEYRRSIAFHAGKRGEDLSKRLGPRVDMKRFDVHCKPVKRGRGEGGVPSRREFDKTWGIPDDTFERVPHAKRSQRRQRASYKIARPSPGRKA